MSQPADPNNVVADIDQARAGLFRLLRSKDAGALAQRPPSNEWSVLENVRHLLFAEQLHLGTFLPDGFDWSRLGLTQRRASKYEEVGKDPSEDLEEVLQAWDAVHQPIREAVKGGDAQVQNVLTRHLRHLVYHINIIESLLS